MANGILLSIGIYNLMIWFDLEPKYKIRFIIMVFNAFICTLVAFIALILQNGTWPYVAFISGIMIGQTKQQKIELYEFIYNDKNKKNK